MAYPTTTTAGGAHFTTRRLHRKALLWRIVLTDGTVLRITNHDAAIIFVAHDESAATTFVPTDSITGGAQRKESDLGPMNRELLAILAAGAVTYDDLLRGFFDNAVVTEYIVDWKYPEVVGHGGFEVYRILGFGTSEDVVELDAQGASARLARTGGQISTSTCPYLVFKAGGRCNLARSAETPTFDPTEIITRHTIDVTTTGGTTNFQSSGSIINGTNYPNIRDGYFINCWVRWTAGGDIGTVSRISSFLVASNSFVLRDARTTAFSTSDKYSMIGFKTTGLTPNTVTDRDTFEGSTSDFSTTNFPEIADNYFNGSKILWTSGLNINTTSRVRKYTHSSRTFELQTPTFKNISTADTFTLLETCDRSLFSAFGCAKFNNNLNFGAEPYIPGQDRVRETPG